MAQINLAAHSDQRVGIFIDTQNLYHSAKSNYRSNVNYDELVFQAVHGRKLVRAFAYVIKSEDNTEEKFFEAIQEIGIEIRVKDLQIFHTGAKKADWDVGIAVDIIRLTEKLDVVVLASGDGDFIEVIRYCKSRGVRVEVMAFEKTTNAQIIEEADHFVDLGDQQSEFLISTRRKKTGYYDKPKLLTKSVEAPTSRLQADNYLNTVQLAPVSQTPVSSPNDRINGYGTNFSPYSGSNLSQINRLSSGTTKKVNPAIFSRESGVRKIKPVIGLPGKSNSSRSLPRLLVNDQTKNKTNRDNAFGNAQPIVKKKLF